MRIAIQGCRATDVTADRRDKTINQTIPSQFAFGYRSGGHRDHVERRQNRVYDSCRGRSVLGLELGGPQALLRAWSTLRHPDSHLQHTVVRCIRHCCSCNRPSGICPSFIAIWFSKEELHLLIATLVASHISLSLSKEKANERGKERKKDMQIRHRAEKIPVA